MHPRTRKRILKKYPEMFDATLERCLNSPLRHERDWLFLGYDYWGEYPILLPREKLFMHGLFLGDSGSGKTAKGIIPLAIQLIASGTASVWVLDAKGDLYAFNAIKEEAERNGVTVKFFTIQPDWPSFVWNPLHEPFLSRMGFATRSQFLLSLFALDYGNIYGGAFWAATMRLFIARIWERYQQSILSFADLYACAADAARYKGLGPRADWEKAQHIISELYGASAVVPWSATPNEFPNRPELFENAISVEESLSRPTVNYFFLPSTTDSYQPITIGRAVLLSLLAGAGLRPPGSPRVPNFIFVDEAQQYASRGLPLFLNMARSKDLGCILAHQSLDQLKLGSDLDLTQVILSATHFKQVFRASDLVIRDFLTKSSGEARYHRIAWSQDVSFDRDGEPIEACFRPELAPIDPWTGNPHLGASEYSGPGLEPNTIMQASSDPALSLVNFTSDEGPIQFGAAWTPVISGFHLDTDNFLRLKDLPWPEPSASTVVNQVNWKSRSNQAAPHVSQATEDLNRRIQRRLEQFEEDQSSS